MISESEDDIDIRELFYDIFDIVKFELQFYKDKESPMFEKTVKTRAFQNKLKKLQIFIFKYFEKMYQSRNNPISKAALRSQLNNMARMTNYYDNLSNFYSDQSDALTTKEKLKDLIEYSHIEVLFLIFTNILDWEHYKSSLLFPTDKGKEKMLKEFLERLASSDIKNVDDIIDLEQQIDTFVEAIGV